MGLLPRQRELLHDRQERLQKLLGRAEGRHISDAGSGDHAHLDLVVRQERQVERDDGRRGLRLEHLAELLDVVGHHVSHAPGLVLRADLHDREDLRLPLGRRLQLPKGDAVADREYSHRVLLVPGELHKDRDQLAEHGVLRDDLRDGAEHVGGLASHHRRLVPAEPAVALQEVVLLAVAHLRQRCREEAAHGDARGVRFRGRKAVDQGAEVAYHLLLGHFLDERLEGLRGFLAHGDLLHVAQLLERARERMGELGAANPIHPAPKLIGQRNEHLVLVVNDLLQEGQELFARPLGTQRHSDGAQVPDRVQAQL
mmetsp:Transcript_29538/g.75187  ORF Transcript_29538/g.75187 Transcript_29538/m.75187 type:complete len:312 (+) Transcript_29538:848-1783(+)